MRDAIDAMRQPGLRTERVLAELAASRRELADTRRQPLDGREPGPGTA